MSAALAISFTVLALLGPAPFEGDRASTIKQLRAELHEPPRTWGGSIGLTSGTVYIPTPPPPPPPEQQYTLLGAGPAAYYSSSFDWGGWYHIYELQVSWGHYGGPATHDNRWCVHPDIYHVGIRLLLISGGVEIWCTTGDFVQEHHKAQWRAKWGIEVSWTLWNELPDPGYVEVYR